MPEQSNSDNLESEPSRKPFELKEGSPFDGRWGIKELKSSQDKIVRIEPLIHNSIDDSIPLFLASSRDTVEGDLWSNLAMSFCLCPARLSA